MVHGQISYNFVASHLDICRLHLSELFELARGVRVRAPFVCMRGLGSLVEPLGLHCRSTNSFPSRFCVHVEAVAFRYSKVKFSISDIAR